MFLKIELEKIIKYVSCIGMKKETNKQEHHRPFCADRSVPRSTQANLMKGVTTEDSSFSFVRLLHFTWKSKIKWRRILLHSFPFRFLNFIYGSLKTGLFEVWVSMNESLWRLSGFNYLMWKAPRHFSFFLV